MDKIDRARYVTVPRTNGRRLLALARQLGKNVPAKATPQVLDAAIALAVEVERVGNAFVARYRESGATLAAEESELDTVVDILLYIFRDRLEHWQVFERPGVRRLAEAQTQTSFDFAVQIERAALAKRAHALLFARGLFYTRLPYPDQAEHMIVLFKLIEQESLGDELDALVGEPFMPALRECHEHYQEMVARRALRTQGSSVNLRTLNGEMQRAILNYQIALLAMIKDDDEANVASIRKALRPVDALREQLLRERVRALNNGQDLDEVDAELVEDLDALVAEEVAVEAELVGE